MTIIRVEGVSKPIAVSMTWTILRQSTSERSEVKQIVNLHRQAYGCIIGDRSAGLRMVGLTSDRTSGAVSGAAWLAAASEGQPIVLAEPLADERVWICAVRAGLPLSGLDMVVSDQDLVDRLNDVLHEVPGSVLHSTIAGLDDRFPGLQAISFAELARQGGAPVKIKRLSGIDPKVLVLAAIGAGLIYGVPEIQDYLATSDRQQAAAKLRAINAEQGQRERERQVAAMRAQLDALDENVRTSVTARPRVALLVNAYLATVEKQPFLLQGWRAVAFDCSGPSCTLSWRRESYGTVLSMTEGAEAKGLTLAAATGNDATTSHAAEAEPRPGSLDGIAVEAPFFAAIDTALQPMAKANVRYTIGKPSLLTPPPPPQGASAPLPAVVPAERQWKVGVISISGRFPSVLRQVAEAIDHPGLAVKSLQMDLKANTWKLEMNYATR